MKDPATLDWNSQEMHAKVKLSDKGAIDQTEQGF